MQYFVATERQRRTRAAAAAAPRGRRRGRQPNFQTNRLCQTACQQQWLRKRGRFECMLATVVRAERRRRDPSVAFGRPLRARRHVTHTVRGARRTRPSEPYRTPLRCALCQWCADAAGPSEREHDADPAQPAAARRRHTSGRAPGATARVRRRNCAVGVASGRRVFGSCRVVSRLAAARRAGRGRRSEPCR